jgi:hypothetical protein
VTITAVGLELSTEADVASIAVAVKDGAKWMADLVFYGSPDEAVAQCSRLYGELDSCGVFADPLPCAGIVDDLRLNVWAHLLGPEDVSAAAWQFTTEVRHRRVKLGTHPALKKAMQAAMPRHLGPRWAYERRKVNADQSPLNSAAFAVWGLRKNESVSEPGVWAF